MRFVPKWEVPERWGHVAPFLRKALARQTAWSEESIYTELMNERMHLWETEGAAFVTQIQTYPLERLCVIVMCGGSGMKGWTQEAVETMTHYARGYGCNAITVVGRKGWSRVWPALEEKETVMRAEL